MQKAANIYARKQPACNFEKFSVIFSCRLTDLRVGWVAKTSLIDGQRLTGEKCSKLTLKTSFTYGT